MRIKGGKKGFTLVELSLSIGFIAILSLTITLIINDTAATYRRGITLRGTCSTMFTGSSGGSGNSAVEKCESDDAGSMIILRRMGYVDVDEDGEIDKDDSDDGGSEKIPVFGAICLGSFTYIWNSGYYFGENATGIKANDVFV